MPGKHPPPWQPYCGQEFHGPVSGHPVICDSERHPGDVMHRNAETGYQWRGFTSYPRTPLAPRADEEDAA